MEPKSLCCAEVPTGPTRNENVSGLSDPFELFMCGTAISFDERRCQGWYGRLPAARPRQGPLSTTTKYNSAIPNNRPSLLRSQRRPGGDDRRYRVTGIKRSGIEPLFACESECIKESELMHLVLVSGAFALSQHQRIGFKRERNVAFKSNAHRSRA